MLRATDALSGVRKITDTGAVNPCTQQAASGLGTPMLTCNPTLIRLAGCPVEGGFGRGLDGGSSIFSGCLLPAEVRVVAVCGLVAPQCCWSSTTSSSEATSMTDTTSGDPHGSVVRRDQSVVRPGGGVIRSGGRFPGPVGVPDRSVGGQDDHRADCPGGAVSGVRDAELGCEGSAADAGEGSAGLRADRRAVVAQASIAVR